MWTRLIQEAQGTRTANFLQLRSHKAGKNTDTGQALVITTQDQQTWMCGHPTLRKGWGNGYKLRRTSPSGLPTFRTGTGDEVSVILEMYTTKG